MGCGGRGYMCGKGLDGWLGSAVGVETDQLKELLEVWITGVPSTISPVKPVFGIWKFVI